MSKESKDTKKKIAKPTELDCAAIGCSEGMSQSDLESSDGVWLFYEKLAESKVWEFIIKIEETNIDYMETLRGAKPKPQKLTFVTSQLTRLRFDQMIAEKKSEGYRFASAKF